MKCDYCQNKATLEITEVNGERISEHHICEACLAETLNEIMRLANRQQTVSRLSQDMHQAVDKQSFLCKHCGYNFEEFVQYDITHCPKCSRKISTNVKSQKKKNRPKDRVLHPQNRVKHIIAQKPQEAKIDILRKALKSAIEKEEYEKAAHLRDAIKKIEHNN